MELSDALAYWWVLDDDHRARRREATIWASTGHAAAVYGDELYDILPQTRGGYGRLQDFGIRFGYERVVLHLQPQVQAGRLECNTARTLLLSDHEPLPWARWGEEFTAAMPDEIRQLQERAASADMRPPPGSDPQPRQRDHAALPTEPVPPDTRRDNARSRMPRATTRPTRPRDPTACRTAVPDEQADNPAGARARRAPRQPADRGRSRSAAPPGRQICPTSRGSPPATAPARRGTSRTRPPDITPAATS